MKRLLKTTSAAGVLSIAIGACSQETGPSPTADIILTNGYIYIADENHTVAEAIAVSGNRILAVGSNAEIAAYKGTKTIVRDMEGKMVMPGLHDTHIHALGSVKPDMCDLDGEVFSLAELVPIIQDCIVKYDVPEGEWVPVLQWNPFEGNQPSAQYPTLRAALDAASPDHPIIMWGADGHHGAVNTAALQSADVPITADTIKTTYAEFESYIAIDDSGEPTGGIMEEARNIVRADMDADMLGVSTPSHSLMPRVARSMAAWGITSLQDAAVTDAILDHYLWLDKNGDFTFRLRTALVAHPDPAAPDAETAAKGAIEELLKLRKKAKAARYIDTSAIKIFADGVLEGNPRAEPPTMPNAAVIDGFLQPTFTLDEKTGMVDVTGYVDLGSGHCKAVQESPASFTAAEVVATFKAEHGYAPSQCIKHYGKLATPEALIKALVKEATKAGFNVHIHAIADEAVRICADAFEAVKSLADSKGLTQSIAHLQIGKPEDVERLSALGAFVSFTYVWARPSPGYEMTVIPFIDHVHGKEDLYNPDHYYMKNAYPVRSVLESGGYPVFGSDAPVGSRNPVPFLSMEIALTRANQNIVLNASERIGIHQAIASYTRNSAKFMARQDELGTLEAGKLADIIVLDRNIVELAESGQQDDISETKVLTTIFDGRFVFDAEK